MSHGSPRHSRMSNVLEPMELLIPIDPCPVRVISYVHGSSYKSIIMLLQFVTFSEEYLGKYQYIMSHFK
jgi:hypothetical protein